MLHFKVSSAWYKSLSHRPSNGAQCFSGYAKICFSIMPFQMGLIFQDMFSHMEIFSYFLSFLEIPLSFRDLYSRNKIRLLSCALSSELALAILLNVCWCQK